MNKSESIKEIAGALSNFNSEVRNISKDRVNPHLKSEYSSLDHIIEECKPILSKNGLSVMQFPSEEEGQVAVTSLLLHKSGEWIETPSIRLRPVKSDPQGIGSAITYGRRYGYAALLSLSLGDDDDGNASSGRAAPPAQSNAPSAIELISEGQGKMIRAKTMEAGYQAKDANDLVEALGILLGRDEVKKFADIRKSEYDTVIKWLAAQPKRGN